MNNVMNDFVVELQSILDGFYIAPNGQPIRLMKDQGFIDRVKQAYLKEANPKVEPLVKKLHESGVFTKEAIRGVISDVFFSYFQQDI